VFRPVPRRGNFSCLGRPLVELCSPSGVHRRPATTVPWDRRLALLGFGPLQRKSRCEGLLTAGLPHPLRSDFRVVPRDSLLPACSPRILAVLFTPPHSWGFIFRAFALTRIRCSFPSSIFPLDGWRPVRCPPWFGCTEGVTPTFDPRIVEWHDYPALRDLLPV